MGRRHHRLSPAPDRFAGYTLNHEEVAKALEEGIGFAERLTPEEVLLDGFGSARALRLSSQAAADTDPGAPPLEVVLPARTILVAAGTQPNTVLGREEPQHVAIDGKYFQAFDENGQNRSSPERTTKPSAAHVLMSVRPDGRSISFFGDLHPSFAGNVVKAMASAKQGYPVVSRMLERQPASAVAPAALMTRLDDELRPIVHAINRLTPTIVEVVVRAPMAARAFAPGQFYRLQNYETLSRSADGTRLAMEGLALTGAWVDREHGLAVDHRARDGRLVRPVRAARAGRAGRPHGADRHADRDAVGRDRAARRRRPRQRRAVLDRPGAARQRQPRDLFRRLQDARSTATRSRRSSAPATSSCGAATRRRASAPTGRRTRPSPATSSQAIDAYGSGALGGPAAIPLGEVDRIIAIGSDGMMAAVKRARARHPGAASQARA